MAFVGHPILDEIKTGIRLKPTKTVDKSAPVILADGERRNRIDRGSCPPPAPPLNSLAPPAPPVPRASSSSPTVASLRDRKAPSVDRDRLLESIRGGVRLRSVQTRDKSSPILDRPVNESRSNGHQSPANRFEQPEEIDYDRSLCTPTSSSASYQSAGSTERTPSPQVLDHRSIPPPPPPPLPSTSSNQFDKNTQSTASPTKERQEKRRDDNSSTTGSEETSSLKRPVDFVFNEGDLYVTGEKLQREIPTGKAALGKSIFDSPENISPPSFLPEHQRKLSLNSYLRSDSRTNVGPPDASFDEAALKVTSEALRREIPAGTAAGKIARFANPDQIGQTNSLPRLRFKPGQLRTPFHESDSNLTAKGSSENESGGTLPRAKSPSTGFLTQRAARPFEIERTRPYSPGAPSLSSQQRSSSIGTPPFARSLFDRPSLPDIKPDIIEKTSNRPYESVFQKEYERAASPYKGPQARSTLITPSQALGQPVNVKWQNDGANRGYGNDIQAKPVVTGTVGQSRSTVPGMNNNIQSVPNNTQSKGSMGTVQSSYNNIQSSGNNTQANRGTVPGSNNNIQSKPVGTTVSGTYNNIQSTGIANNTQPNRGAVPSPYNNIQSTGSMANYTQPNRGTVTRSYNNIQSIGSGANNTQSRSLSTYTTPNNTQAKLTTVPVQSPNNIQSTQKATLAPRISNPTIVPNNPSNKTHPWVDSPRKPGSQDNWVTVASPASKVLERGRSDDRSHIVYTVQNGQPKTSGMANTASQSSPRPRSTSRPAWREQTQQNRNDYTYHGGISPSSSSYTYNAQPQPVSSTATYTPINFQPSARQPRTLHHTRSASEMSRPIAVRTDFLPTSPLQSVEPSPVSPLRPLEVRDVHTSPMVSARSPFSQGQTQTRGTAHRQNGRASSPESSMSSQQSPSSLSPGNTSPRDTANNNHKTNKFEALPSMPRPFFGTYRTSDGPSTNSNHPQNTSIQADALKAAVLEAASNKISTSGRLISVPIASPWHQNAQKTTQSSRTLVSPQDICHLNPESMRGNFRFNIDIANDTPLTITRR